MKNLLRFILALVVVVAPVVLVQLGFAQLGIGKFQRHVMAALVSIPACYLAYYAYVRYVEKRAVTELAPQGLFRGELSGPAWLSGGAFGAEGSLVAVVLCGSVGGVLLRKAWQRHEFVRLFWRAEG